MSSSSGNRVKSGGEFRRASTYRSSDARLIAPRLSFRYACASAPLVSFRSFAPPSDLPNATPSSKGMSGTISKSTAMVVLGWGKANQFRGVAGECQSPKLLSPWERGYDPSHETPAPSPRPQEAHHRLE